MITEYGKDLHKEKYDLPHEHDMNDHLSLQVDTKRGNDGHIEIMGKHMDDEVHEPLRDNDKDDHKRLPKMHVHAHPSMHMDPALSVFFTVDDLQIGKSMPIYFPQKGPSTTPRLLLREEADSIPFSSTQLPYLLEFFSFPKESPQAKGMGYTLGQCELKPIEGETKFCATSFESLLDFARSFFGLDTRLNVLTTTPLRNSTILIQNYTIVEVKENSAPKKLACHTMPYPYAIFYCHGQQIRVDRLYEVSLDGENGETVQAAAICHMDTSQWDRHHVSFRVLRVEPGSCVCHFFSPDTIIWVPAMAV